MMSMKLLTWIVTFMTHELGVQVLGRGKYGNIVNLYLILKNLPFK